MGFGEGSGYSTPPLAAYIASSRRTRQGPRRRLALHGPSTLSGPAASTPGPAGGTRRIKGGWATSPPLLALAGGRAPSPWPTLKGGRGNPGRHHAAASRPVPLCPSPLPARWSETCLGRGARGARGAGRGLGSGCLAASPLSRVNTFRRPCPLLPTPVALPAVSLRLGATYPARPSSAVRGADSASRLSREPPPGGSGSRGQALCPYPVRTPLSDMQKRRVNEQQEGEYRPLRGRRPASPLHASPPAYAATPVQESACAPRRSSRDLFT